MNKHEHLLACELPDGRMRPDPQAVTLTGRTCRLEPIDPAKHGDGLFAAYTSAPDVRDWTYMDVERFVEIEPFREYIETIAQGTNSWFYAVIDLTSDKAVGLLSLMSDGPRNGAIEIGHAAFSPLHKHTIQSTEAQFLLLSYVFDQLGYQRCVRKIDSLNTPSRKAAQRLGFTFRRIFRSDVVHKNRSHFTALFAINDKEWPALKMAFETWLAPKNFDGDGKQIRTLAAFQENVNS